MKASLITRIAALEIRVAPDVQPALVQIIGLDGPTGEQLQAAAAARARGQHVVTAQTYEARVRPDPEDVDA